MLSDCFIYSLTEYIANPVSRRVRGGMFAQRRLFFQYCSPDVSVTTHCAYMLAQCILHVNCVVCLLQLSAWLSPPLMVGDGEPAYVCKWLGASGVCDCVLRISDACLYTAILYVIVAWLTSILMCWCWICTHLIVCLSMVMWTWVLHGACECQQGLLLGLGVFLTSLILVSNVVHFLKHRRFV